MVRTNDLESRVSNGATRIGREWRMTMDRNQSRGLPRRPGETSLGLYRGVALGSLLGATALLGGGCGDDSNAAVGPRSLARAPSSAQAEPEGAGPRAIDKAW